MEKVVPVVCLILVCLGYMDAANGKTDYTCPSYCQCERTLQNEAVTCQGPGYDFQPDLLPVTVNHLTIKEAFIPRLDNGTFGRFTMLEELSLNDCNITEVHPLAFRGLRRLEQLDLTGNGILLLPVNLLQDSSKLHSLHLSRSGLTGLSQEVFFGLKNLEELLLDGNGINDLECDVFGQSPSLKHLDLSHNNLGEIQLCILNPLQSLISLNLQNNKITQIHFKDLPLANNELTTNDDSAKQGLFKLEMLDLSGNLFPSIQTEIWQSVLNVKRLDLSRNPLTQIPSRAFAGLEHVEDLFLMEMPVLTSVQSEAFGGLPRLQHLYLSQNPQLTSLDKEALPGEELNRLSTVIISDNHLQNFQEKMFLPLKGLTTVDIHRNVLHCNCHNRWISQALRNQTYTWLNSNSDVICFTPTPLRGILIKDLDPKDLTCEPPVIAPLTPTEIEVLRGETFKLQVALWRGVPACNWLLPTGVALHQGMSINIHNVKYEVTEHRFPDGIIQSTLTVDNFTETTTSSFVAIATNADAVSSCSFIVTYVA